EKHNEANGEGNRDGHSENFSANLGVEGPTSDPAILAARARRQRAMLATLFFSQGVPMLLAGDEAGNSQGGNNNAYAQDNETGWTDWSGRGGELEAFVARLSALRRRFSVLRQKRFLHGSRRKTDGLPDLEWWHPDGRTPEAADWEGDLHAIGLIVRTAAETCADGDEPPVFLLFNAGKARPVVMPPGPWTCLIDSANPGAPPRQARPVHEAPEQSVLLFAHPET
ncbi:MAG: glycogen debranching enzyme GlgX, partial [Alphaproteobacteria bacterium]